MNTTNPESIRIANQNLRRRVLRYLAGHQHPSLERLTVEANDGTVKLRGCVHSFYEKQLAINCSQSVAGVTELVDAVRVL